MLLLGRYNNCIVPEHSPKVSYYIGSDSTVSNILEHTTKKINCLYENSSSECLHFVVVVSGYITSDSLYYLSRDEAGNVFIVYFGLL